MNQTYEGDYATHYDFFNDGKKYEEEVEFLEKVFLKYGNQEVRTILNLGCGTGMHEMYLSKKGFQLSGLDLSPEMIRIAQSKKIPCADFSVGDMSQFSLNKKFDVCTIMFSALGYVLENKNVESTFLSVANHLSKKGLFVLEVWNGLGVMHLMPSSRKKDILRDELVVHRQSFPTLHAAEHRVDVQFKVDIFEKGLEKEQYTEMHRVRFFFPQELKYYLEKTGFEVLEICKTFDLDTTVDENDWNMVIIARKK